MARRTIPACLLALGREPLPRRITLPAGTYALEQVYKHDFFAATARYAGPSGKVVLKIGRKASFLGLPLGWIGRLHAWHESRAYCRLSDLAAVPKFEGRFGDHGFAHAYVDGRPLARGARVPDDFFATLATAIRTLHACGMAYVDLNKPENVLLGSDGRPYLVDFQIAWNWPRRLGGDRWPLRWVRTRLQQADLYHLAKLHRRIRPDQLSEEQRTATYARPGHVRAYSRITRPFTLARRWLLERIDPRRSNRERGTVENSEASRY